MVAKGTGFFRDMTPMLAYVSVVGSLGAMSFGYDNGWWGLILGAPYFNAQYGELSTPGAAGAPATVSLSSTQQSVGTAMGTLGICIGCMVAPFLNERYGRKFMFMLLAVVSIIGVTIQAVSTIMLSYACLIVGKIVLNIAVGFAAAVVAGYLSECSPASLRGALVMQYNTLQNVGYVAAGITVYCVISYTNRLNYLLPIAIQYVLPVIILVTTPFLPESPRWLVSKGRLADALRSIKQLRGKTVTDEEAEAEVQEIARGFEEMRQIHTGNGWVELFKGANLRRTLIAIGLQSLQQAQGVSFVANYLVVTFLGLGITNVYLIILMIYVELLVFSSLGVYTSDKFGRRALLITGGIVQTICMTISGTISAVYPAGPTGQIANLFIATFFIWVAIFSVTWSPMPWTISSEISSNPLREKTLALAAFSGFAVGLIVGFVSPYLSSAPTNWGGKIFLFWAGWSLVSTLFAFFFVPELKYRSLEELDLMFEAGIGARHFASCDVEALKAAKHPDDAQVAPISEDKKDIEFNQEHVEYNK